MKRRKPIRRKSVRQVKIDYCKDLLREILKLERGAKCEICGRGEDQLPMPLSLFHILNTQRYPRIQLHKENVLLACWARGHQYSRAFCHNAWHQLSHNDAEYQRVANKIIELRGQDYRDRLLILDKTIPKLTMVRLHMIREAFKSVLEELKEK